MQTPGAHSSPAASHVQLRPHHRNRYSKKAAILKANEYLHEHGIEWVSPIRVSEWWVMEKFWLQYTMAYLADVMLLVDLVNNQVRIIPRA
jgi:hypothetical protein